METDSPRSKVNAIYDLREAVEAKAQAEHELERHATPAARDALLAAQLDVEAKTQDAIDVCHECGHTAQDGHTHPPRPENPRIGERSDNVVHVDFRPEPDEGCV
jgi:hypothetical protein